MRRTEEAVMLRRVRRQERTRLLRVEGFLAVVEEVAVEVVQGAEGARGWPAMLIWVT